jgi:large subunit ribosomal protein L18
MAIMVSCKNMYVQFVDDEKGVTLASVSTLKGDGKNNVAVARGLGRNAAEVALKKGIKSVVIDRGGFKFHGRVKAIVDAAGEAGLAVGIKKEK